MTALGIMSVLVMVVMRAQQSAIHSTGDLRVNSEVNNLYQLLTTELSRVETCNKNFAGKASGYTPTFILNKAGTVRLIENNKEYGQELKIQTLTVAYSGTGAVWNLTVNYLPHLTDPHTHLPVPARSFIIPITAYSDGAGNIKSCFSDVRGMIEKAVEYACDTSHGVYTAGAGSTVGTCNAQFDVKGASGAVVGLTSGTTYLCPAGEFLQQATIDTTSKKLTFQCASTLNTVACKPWEYIKGFNAVTGKAECLDVRTLFTSGTPTGLMVTRAGVYTNVTLDCTGGGATPTKILQSINADGTLNCVDPYISLACPVNYFLTGIDYTTVPGKGTPICAKVTNDVPPPCPAGSYMTAVSSTGDVTCKSGTLTCGSSQYISGISASANANCVNMP